MESKKMSITGIAASHRENSNSELLLDYVLESLATDGETTKFNLLEKNIKCWGCEQCYSDAFFHKDDLEEVYETALAVDVLILATPTYFGMPSSLMKVFMDRSNALWLQRKLKGKIGAVIVNGASRFGGIELCAKNIGHYLHDHEMISVPFYACFNSSINHPEERFPRPLPSDLREPLDKLAKEIRDLFRF